MRLSLFLSFFFLVFHNSLISQTSKWPSADATWWVERTMPHGLFIPHPTDPNTLLINNGMLTTQIYYELGDTITLDGKRYTELLQDYESHFESFTGDTTVDYPLTGTPTIRGYLRAAGDQVFFKEFLSLPEELLYDFDLKLGDTVPTSFINHKPFPVVDSIDFVTIDGAAHRRFFLKGVGIFSDVIIEGVGNKNGPIQELGLGFEINHRLICYRKDGLASYPDTGSVCSDAPTNIVEYDQFSNIKVIPHPIVNEARIHFGIKQEPQLFRLYSFEGRLVRSENISSSDSFVLKRSGLQNGYYLLQLKYKNGQTEHVKVLFVN